MTKDKHKILAIAHRVCPALAKTAVGFATKEEMVQATTRSLAASLASFDGAVRLLVILDGCPSYRTFFTEVFASADNVQISFEDTPSIGNQATYAKQFEILLEEKDADYLYFSEDDYIYQSNAFAAMAEFLDHESVDFVTPLDHPDRYKDIVPQSAKVEIRLSAHCHWREVGSTCCTFMTKKSTFHKAKRLLAAYGLGSNDGALWIGLTKDRIFSPKHTLCAAFRFLTGRRKTPEGLEFTTLAAWRWHKWRLPFGHRYRLWGPIPSLAVHLCKPSLPPFWEKIVAGALQHNPTTIEQC